MVYKRLFLCSLLIFCLIDATKAAKRVSNKIAGEEITLEEVNEIEEDTKQTEKVEHDENDEMMNMWEKEMSDFIPDVHINTDIKGKADDVIRYRCLVKYRSTITL
jgi:hypothetical protein